MEWTGGTACPASGDPEKRRAYDRQIEQEQRIPEERRAGFDPGRQENPFLSYSPKVNEALRRRSEKS